MEKPPILTDDEIRASYISTAETNRLVVTPSAVNMFHRGIARDQIDAALKWFVGWLKTKAWQTGQYGTKIQGYLVTAQDIQELEKLARE